MFSPRTILPERLRRTGSKTGESVTGPSNLPLIRAKGFTENVADLAAAKLGRLSETTRGALGQLACLGNIADIATLSLVYSETEDAVRSDLWEAVRASFVFVTDSGSYAFAHARIQEAAYSIIPGA